MSDLRATLLHVRFVLFGNEHTPAPNAPAIGDTLWADGACTLQDYIDDALDRDTTASLNLPTPEEAPREQTGASK